MVVQSLTEIVDREGTLQEQEVSLVTSLRGATQRRMLRVHRGNPGEVPRLARATCGKSNANWPPFGQHRESSSATSFENAGIAKFVEDQEFDAAGLKPGLYFVRAVSGESVMCRKMMLLR